jgi:outer membrane protein insertion porin family
MRRTFLLILSTLGAWSLAAQTPDSVALDTPPADLPMMDYTRTGRFVVREVRVHGSNYYDATAMPAYMGLFPGDTITLPGDYASSAIRKVMSMRFFSDVQVVTTPEAEGDGVSFDVYLTERPRVRRWTYEGIRNTEVDDLTKSLKLRPGDELSDYILDKNKYFIRKYFSEKGFRNATVTTRITNDTLMLNGVNVAFVIDKKSKVRIGAVNILGNEEFSDKKLQRSFKKSHPVSWKFWQNNKYKEPEYAEDKELLVDFYNSKGYRNATVIRDSIYTTEIYTLRHTLSLHDALPICRTIWWTSRGTSKNNPPTRWTSQAAGEQVCSSARGGCSSTTSR